MFNVDCNNEGIFPTQILICRPAWRHANILDYCARTSPIVHKHLRFLAKTKRECLSILKLQLIEFVVMATILQ